MIIYSHVGNASTAEKTVTFTTNRNTPYRVDDPADFYQYNDAGYSLLSHMGNVAFGVNSFEACLRIIMHREKIARKIRRAEKKALKALNINPYATS